MVSISADLRERLVAAMEEGIPIVERLIGCAKDREVRNGLVRRLALFDQRLAALRDVSDLPADLDDPRR